MYESRGGHPIQVALVVLLLAGAGWYFFNHYNIDGLDGVSVYPKQNNEYDDEFFAYTEAPLFDSASTSGTPNISPVAPADPTLTLTATRSEVTEFEPAPVVRRRYRKLRIASWALDGFGPTKFASGIARKNLARVIRQFDIVALQQVASIERDLVPRMVDAINQGDVRYDYLLGESSGPPGRQEQLAFIYDAHRVTADRKQTYTLEDPQDQLTFDPLVAWFRAAEPTSAEAWTFSLVNVRVDLARAPQEVALLPAMVSSISNDGREEDDILMVGLFQADDAYLLPTIGAEMGEAAVEHVPTDIFGKYQTSNILIDRATTSEFLGGGGIYDYRRRDNLTTAEVETVTSHLPVYAEFTALEGGQL